MMYINQIIMLYLKLIQCYTSIISIKLEENAFKQKEKKNKNMHVQVLYIQSQLWFANLYITMAPHSSTLAWKILRTEEPGRLQSMGSLIVGHDWATSLSFFTFMHWRRKWQPTPVFLSEESQGQRSLVGFCLWGRTELDTTEALSSSSNNLLFFLKP